MIYPNCRVVSVFQLFPKRARRRSLSAQHNREWTNVQEMDHVWTIDGIALPGLGRIQSARNIC